MPRFSAADGIELHYLEESPAGGGTGAPPLVMLPGWSMSAGAFRAQLGHFGQSRRCIALDPRSHGASTDTTSGNDYATLAGDVAALVAHLGLGRIALMAWSFGSVAAWEFVARQGTEALSSLIIIDEPPAPMLGGPEDWTSIKPADVAAFQRDGLVSDAAKRALFEGIARHYYPDDPAEAEWFASLADGCPHWAALLYNADGMFADCRAAARAADAALPTLTFIGDYAAERALPYMARELPGTQTAVLPGHSMHITHPGAFNARLESFLADAEERAGQAASSQA
ncbi:alpha/beta fold hydrolase [Pseudoroseicyclus tamaricis]|uniref:Alpha/beta hydrolase n=1 Tax=Pseudoroseicyclus tamaricis TaxID=2705421 RepID=A0A6B2JRW2_9RHOB|nr:alpha/beta hydrolase [Pseudoroseicyclus tamaricis]NDV00938.1 alpha/beta hydrolase [Pseudoroseicyclus tamaricis]